MKNTKLISESVFFEYRKIDCVPENLNSSHCHDKYEILYVSEGRGKYIVEGVEYPIAPRTLMVFPPLSYHCAQIDAGVAYERYLLFFDKSAVVDAVSNAWDKVAELSSTTGAFYQSDAISDTVISIFERLEGVSSYPEQQRDACARLLLSELILYLSVAKSDFLVKDDRELGARVISYLNQNMEKDISLDRLAKRFFVSKYYLCRAFKKHNGISIHGYINQKRVMYAKQLIEAGETASGAAYRVGFGDYSAFYRAYVKLMGRAPTQAEERRKDELRNS